MIASDYRGDVDCNQSAKSVFCNQSGKSVYQTKTAQAVRWPANFPSSCHSFAASCRPQQKDFVGGEKAARQISGKKAARQISARDKS